MGIDIRDPEQPVGTLSGGERQAVAIARAVYFGAKVLILDEPTSALGVKQSGVVLKYILQARERGIAVVFITHNPHHAHMVGDRFYLLNRGQMTNEFERKTVTREELVKAMAGGAELEALAHELESLVGSSRRAVGPGSETWRPSRSASSAPAGWATCTRAPTSAWRQHWPDLAVRPELVAVADSSAAAAETFARAHGDLTTYADWRELLADPDIAAVSVTAPNFLHREIGVAVAEAGKHLWIEKPVGLTADDAIAVRDAVHANGVVGCVGFNYRHVPAVARARRIVESGRDRRPDARAGPAAHRLRRPPGQPALVAVRRRPRRPRRARRPGLARRRPAPLRPRRRHRRDGADRDPHPAAADRRCAVRPGPLLGPRRRRPGAQLRRGRERGLRRGHPPDGVRHAQRLRGQPRRGGGAEQLRVRGARHPGPGALGLPAARASCRSPPATSTPASRPARCSASRATASTPRSSRAPASPWATTTRRSSRPELRQGDLGRGRPARDAGRRRRQRASVLDAMVASHETGEWVELS